ncbi:MAG: hypothetical protein AAFQ98_20970 [Bacteroidota bacterium]
MNQFKFQHLSAVSHTLVQELRKWTTLQTFPFAVRLKHYEPWVHKTDTAAYDVFTTQSDIQVGPTVTRSAYRKVHLWCGGGGNNFPLRPTKEQLRGSKHVAR